MATIKFTILSPPSPVKFNIQPPIKLQATQSGIAVGPPGQKGEKGDTLWEPDTETTIKPIEAKTVNAAYISGEIYGGLFQP